MVNQIQKDQWFLALEKANAMMSRDPDYQVAKQYALRAVKACPVPNTKLSLNFFRDSHGEVKSWVKTAYLSETLYGVGRR